MIGPRWLRDGVSGCLECRRDVDPRVPPTQLLDADECCLWCARRHDGDLRRVTPFLERMGASEAPAMGVRADPRTWAMRTRANSAEIRQRRMGPRAGEEGEA